MPSLRHQPLEVHGLVALCFTFEARCRDAQRDEGTEALADHGAHVVVADLGELTVADLRAAFSTAYRHLHEGGVMVVTPDLTAESFVNNKSSVTSAVDAGKPAHIDVVFVENAYDPDPEDERYETTMVYLIRENGVLRVEVDRSEMGLFPLGYWREALADTGFTVHQSSYHDGSDSYLTFACVRDTGS